MNFKFCFSRKSSNNLRDHCLKGVSSASVSMQLMQNAIYTFELLLNNAIQVHHNDAGSAIEKAKHRVLKVSL